MKRTRQRGFTLIELLVVVIIVAIIGAIFWTGEPRRAGFARVALYSYG